MKTGDLAYFTVDSLSAFWPGLQVLAGDLEAAIKLHMLCMPPLLLPFQMLTIRRDWNMWKHHSGLPEVYDTSYRVATSHQYPLRPGK
jgi:ER degradation enhancer, mannosidase alpha-like 1